MLSVLAFRKSHSVLCLCFVAWCLTRAQADLMKLERDNSLSCSLELTTLDIPWEIFYVLSIKFVSQTFTPPLVPLCFPGPALSMPLFHSFTHLLLHFPCIWAHFFCLFFLLTCLFIHLHTGVYLLLAKLRILASMLVVSFFCLFVCLFVRSWWCFCCLLPC